MKTKRHLRILEKRIEELEAELKTEREVAKVAGELSGRLLSKNAQLTTKRDDDEQYFDGLDDLITQALLPIIEAHGGDFLSLYDGSGTESGDERDFLAAAVGRCAGFLSDEIARLTTPPVGDCGMCGVDPATHGCVSIGITEMDLCDECYAEFQRRTASPQDVKRYEGHTPGPWVSVNVGEKDGCVIVGRLSDEHDNPISQGEAQARLDEDYDCKLYTEGVCEISLQSNDDPQANARLIADAPKLAADYGREHTARVEAERLRDWYKGQNYESQKAVDALIEERDWYHEKLEAAERERDELRVTRDKAVDLWKAETNVSLRLRAELEGRIEPPFYADVVGELEKRERELKAELQLVTAPQPEREKFYRDRITELKRLLREPRYSGVLVAADAGDGSITLLVSKEMFEAGAVVTGKAYHIDAAIGEQPTVGEGRS